MSTPGPSKPSGSTIAVIIPAYRVRDKILDVISTLPPWVAAVYVVDDACPERSGEHVRAHCADARVRVLSHDKNHGVGAAMKTGFRAAMADNHSILVKMDGDGQMDPAYLRRLTNPILDGNADFTKGNRFFDLAALRQMPRIRRTGNFGLTLLTKFASGQWHISDPTNGYLAIHHTALRLLNFDSIARRYFFETSLLIQLNIVRAVVMDVPIPARYGDEKSSLNIGRAFFAFPPRLLTGLAQRLVWRYFIYDVSAVTVLLVFGSIFTAGGAAFGIYRWVIGAIGRTLQSSGTVALALLPIILGFQMLLQALLLDVVDKPDVPLSRLIRDRHEEEG